MNNKKENGMQDFFNLLVKEREKEKEKANSAELIRDIVPIKEWLADEYYVGKDGQKLYDFWKDFLIDVFGTNRGKYNEIILTGSIGTGKSTAALFCMVRKIYELSCYKNMVGLFDFMGSSKIAIIYFTVTQRQALHTGYAQLKDIIDQIPYFRENFPRDDRKNEYLAFPEQLFVTSGSNTSDAIGMNLIGSILDEANFFHQKVSGESENDYDKVSKLYTSILNRSRSRFSDNKFDHSLNILVSSASTASSFTEKRIKASLTRDNIKVVVARLWEVKPAGKYSSELFYVFKGSDFLDPCIVENIVDINIYLETINVPKIDESVSIAKAIESLPEPIKERYIAIPINFKNSFEENIILALQDIAGESVAPVGRLFSSKPVFKSCLDNSIEHPFTKEIFTVATGDDIRIIDFLKPEYIPKDRNKSRYIHIDQSTSSDKTGFAVAYISDFKECDGVKKPIITVECMMCIEPPKPPKKISISKVREHVFYIRDIWHCKIGMVTMDSFGSAEGLQVLEENRFKCGRLSVDKTDEQYLLFIDLMYEGRVKFYHHSLMETELFELIHYRSNRKVDHPKSGSKDLIDAVVGAVWNAHCGYANDFRNSRSYLSVTINALRPLSSDSNSKNNKFNTPVSGYGMPDGLRGGGNRWGRLGKR